MSINDLPSGTTEDTSGTTAQAAADGAVTPAADGAGEVEALRRQIAELEGQKGKWLSEKDGIENDRRRLAEYEARTNATDQQRSVAHYDPAIAGLAYLQEQADAGSQDAAAQLAVLQGVARSMTDSQQFGRMSDAERTGAQRYYASGDFRTPEAALKAWRGDQSAETMRQIEAERAQLAADRKAIENGRTSPNLSPRGVSATDVAARIGASQYNDKLRNARDDDERRKIIAQHGDSVDYGQ